MSKDEQEKVSIETKGWLCPKVGLVDSWNYCKSGRSEANHGDHSAVPLVSLADVVAMARKEAMAHHGRMMEQTPGSRKAREWCAASAAADRIAGILEALIEQP